MSHLSTVKTTIRDLSILDRALRTFGQGLIYAQNDPLAASVIAMDSRETPCEAVILPFQHAENSQNEAQNRAENGDITPQNCTDNPAWRTYQKQEYYGGTQDNAFCAKYCEIGVALQADGTYAFVGDLTYPWGHHDNNSVADQWGWNWHNRRDHSYPLLMREYAIQTGYTLAEQQGMGVVQLPAEAAVSPAHVFAFGVDVYSRPSLGAILQQTPKDATVLLLTGGYLPPHMTIIFTANADGTSSIAVDGGTDSSCYQYTKPFEDALGTVMADTSTLEVCHVLQEGVLEHISR